MTTPATTKLRPMLFSTPMVQGILNERKTQTRRIIKIQPDDNGIFYMENPPIGWEENYKEEWKPWIYDTEQGERVGINCPYGKVGDILWVREAWNYAGDTDFYFYKAGSNYHLPSDMENIPDESKYKYRPSIHMPKMACRIYLEIISLRVERLQTISNKDAIAEGIEFDHISIRYYDYIRECWWQYMDDGEDLESEQLSGKVPFPFKPTHSYETLWEKINGRTSWALNPWVWVVEFKRIEKHF
jgi:hypothetical protein